MPVYKDKNRGTWYISVRKKDINGELKQLVRRGFSTKREAQEEEAKIKLSELDWSSSLTFYDLYSDYIKYNENRIRHSSLFTIKNTIENHVLPYFKNRKVNTITTKDYLNWQYEMNKTNLSHNYKKKIHGVIVGLFNYGI